MRDLKRILELRFENHSQREIARMLKVSRNTVRDVFDAADAAGVYWNTAYNLSESQINELLFPSNGIDVSYEQPDYAYVHKELLKVGVSLKMLWKEYVDQCKSTHKVYLKYSAFCNNYSSYVKKNKLTMHITHKPGDRIMVDWDGKTMKVHDRSLDQDVTAYMFVAVLPFSMYCYVEAVLGWILKIGSIVISTHLNISVVSHAFLFQIILKQVLLNTRSMRILF